MRVKYLLPCSCGEKVAVEVTQAGQNILCSCGKTLEVPTMQGLRRLEQYAAPENQSKATSPTGGVVAGIALLGLIILGAGGALMYRMYSQRPAFVEMDQMTPWDTWIVWQSLRDGVQLPEYIESPYTKAKKVNDQYMTVAVVVMGLGIIIIAISAIIAFFNRNSQGRRISPRAP